ncbi:MAG: hypothetical protein LW878_01940 [Proteobacteria bacterium]|nr:hypothetical protein [Pseudomonadota bacterium]
MPSLFKSQDSKYFLKTAFKVVSVPLITTLLLAYSLWMYVELNYSFFLANGFATGPEMKEAFWDSILMEQIDYIPFLGLFFIAVFFLGLFLAHLVLRPFTYVRNMCEDILKGEPVDSEKGFLNARKLVVKAAMVFFDYLNKRDKSNDEGEFDFPQELEKIHSPKPDGVFYLQYGVFMLILSVITILATTFTLNHLHESIVEVAIKMLKPSTSLNVFLTSQQDHLFTIAAVITVLTIFLYSSLARGIIREIEGVSYSYLRDIRDITSGDHSRRLRPRFQDPGQEAAFAINQVMNLFFPEADK